MGFNKHTSILSIAGFDPSGGAGVLADCKTFEQTGEYGCAISSSITYQNDEEFHGIRWLAFEEIEKQFKSLSNRFKFEFVKIGLIENMDTLSKCISMLKEYNNDIKIIWDPILKASAGFEFHSEVNKYTLENVLKDIFLITPNGDEARQLFPKGVETTIHYCNILLKGGHEEGEYSKDILYTKEDKTIFTEKRIEGYSKHGSGCVLSAAITAFLNKGYTLTDACREAKQYTLAFLKSSPERIGFHHTISTNAIAD